MPRYRLTLEYDGTPFSGWQWQDHASSVQRVLAEALVALCGHAVKVTGAPLRDGLGPLSISVVVELVPTTRANAILESAPSGAVQRMAENLVEQLIELMPELAEVSPWHSVGQRRSLEELGRIARPVFLHEELQQRRRVEVDDHRR